MKNTFPSLATHIWRPAAWLKVAGQDAFDFLQGQFTNDLHVLDTQPAVYGLWLDQKGRVLADSFVLKAGPAAFWVGSYFSPAATLRQRIEAYIVADDVTVADETAAWAGVTLIGAEMESVAGKIDAPLRFAGRRASGPGLEFLFAVETLPLIEARLDVLQLPRHTADEMERLRIHAGITAVPRDLGPADLPNEGGLDAVAISYTKGCYLGQEVMARLKSMGRVRRRVLRVAGTGTPPALPAAVFQGAKKTGELRSAAVEKDGFIGLAMLSLLNLDPHSGLSFTPEGVPIARLVEPDGLEKN